MNVDKIEIGVDWARLHSNDKTVTVSVDEEGRYSAVQLSELLILGLARVNIEQVNGQTIIDWTVLHA